MKEVSGQTHGIMTQGGCEGCGGGSIGSVGPGKGASSLGPGCCRERKDFLEEVSSEHTFKERQVGVGQEMGRERGEKEAVVGRRSRLFIKSAKVEGEYSVIQETEVWRRGELRVRRWGGRLTR